MRKLILLAFILTAACALAGDPELLRFTDLSCQTNATPTVTNAPDTDMFLWGWVENVLVDFGGTASPTGTVTLATKASQGTGPSRTILSCTMTADKVYNPRDLAETTAGVDISGADVKLPLCQDKLQLVAYGFNYTGVTLNVYFTLSDAP